MSFQVFGIAVSRGVAIGRAVLVAVPGAGLRTHLTAQLAAWGLTEASSGSDAAAMKTTAETSNFSQTVTLKGEMGQAYAVSLLLTNHDDPFGFGRLRYVRDVNESKALNDLRGPFIVLAASGMCEAGRVLHHLRNNIENPRNTVLITGFQAEQTLGRKIAEGQPEVPIFGEPMRLRAEVFKLDEQ